MQGHSTECVAWWGKQWTETFLWARHDPCHQKQSSGLQSRQCRNRTIGQTAPLVWLLSFPRREGLTKLSQGRNQPSLEISIILLPQPHSLRNAEVDLVQLPVSRLLLWGNPNLPHKAEPKSLFLLPVPSLFCFLCLPGDSNITKSTCSQPEG